jgi:hypothetical protein
VASPKTLVAVTLAAVAITAAGCGGSGTGGSAGGDRLALADFIAQADAICKEYDAKFEALGTPETPAEAADIVRSGSSIAVEQLGKLRELAPPADVEDRINEAYTALDEQIALFDDYAEAADANDTAAVQEISGKLDALNTKADDIAAEIGLEECGNG